MPELFLSPETMRFRVFRYLFRIAAASLLLFGIAGCGAVLDTQSAQIRVVHASRRAGTVDVLPASNMPESAGVAYHLDFGAVTTYFPALSTAYAFASSGGHSELARANIDVGQARHYTVLVRDTSDGIAAQVLTDQDRPAPAGHVLLRVFQAAQDTIAVDLYLVPLNTVDSRTVLLPSSVLSGNTGYASVPSGVYMLYAMTAGVPLHTAAPLYTGPAVSYDAGAVRTLVLIQSAERQPAMVVMTLKDFEPPETPH